MQAVLIVHPGKGEGLTPGIVLAHAATRGVVAEADVERRVAEFLEDLEPRPVPQESVIAEGRPAAAGVDSHVRWDPDLVPAAALAAMPADEAVEDAPDDASPDAPPAVEATVDHYDCSTLKTVDVDAVVGHFQRPTDGTPGRTVTGRELPPRPGRLRELDLDEETLVLQRGGAVVARTAGRVNVAGTRAWIDPVLDIGGDVDFSTGNLDFGGALRVSGGVKDRFVVRCTGDTFIGGLIESATLLIGGDLHCGSGMAAKERGQLVVDGDCEVSYLNQARGRVGGTLTCRRELIESDLVIGGELHVGRGAIVGGTSVVTGRVVVGVLGSGAGATTRLILGEVPLVTRSVRRLRDMAAALDREIQAEETQLAALESADPVMLATVQNEQQQRRERHLAMQRKELELLRRIKRGRTVSLSVERRMHHRAIIGIRGREYEIHEDLRGPLVVLIGAYNEASIAIRGAEPRPLLDFSRLIQPTYVAA